MVGGVEGWSTWFSERSTSQNQKGVGNVKMTLGGQQEYRRKSGGLEIELKDMQRIEGG